MNERQGFGSRLGFILTMAGFCIGVGNLWKFPYMVGNNGGGAFLIVYLLLVLLLGIPAFAIEATLGRSSQASSIAGMRNLTKKGSGWVLIGWCGVIALFLLTSYCVMVVGGWCLGYFGKILSGSLTGLDAEAIGVEFGNFAGSPTVFIWEILLCVLLYFVIKRGIKEGVEKICKILMPLLFVTLVGLAVFSSTMDGAAPGIKWYLTPDFSAISPSVISAAASQVFLSIGVGMAVSFVYGSYLSKQENLFSNVTIAAVLDTIVALISGFIIIPALFTFNIEPTAGPSLIFVTLPNLFNMMPGGRVFGAIFFLCVALAGFTTMVGQVEALTSTAIDMFKFERKKALVIVLVALFVFDIPITLSQGTGILNNVRLIGYDIFTFVDFIASGLILNLGALMMIFFVAFKWGFKKFQSEANIGAGDSKIYVANWMGILFKVVCPLLMIVVFIAIFKSYIG
ncbi:MAG: sodium-dependent transporter [Firmicutes bacterium]|nr:sodium-dependent transporter [Bacillota bacterium]